MSEEEDFAKLPLEQRWRHTKWKARQSAYEEAIARLKRGDQPAAVATVEDLRTCASDSNVIALEVGVQVVTASLNATADVDPRFAVTIRKAVTQPLAEKGLVAAKPAVKQATMDAILALVEVADPAGVVEDLLPLLSQRTPKLVAAGALALNHIYAEFGTPVTDATPVLKQLPPLFSHTDRAVRSNAAALAVSLARWVGLPVILQTLANIKPVQLNEVKQQIESADFSQPVKRMTRQQRHAAEAQANAAASAKPAGADADAGEENDSMQLDNPAPVDPWDFSEPVDVVSGIPGDFWTLVSSSKWKERHEALAAVVPRLEAATRMMPSSDYSPLASELLKVAGKDMNVMCATQAMQGLTALGNGLRHGFSRYALRTCETVVERFKEKKQSVLEIVAQCLDAMFFRVLDADINSILDPLLNIGLGHKTPGTRLEAAKYLSHILRDAPRAPAPADIKRITAPAVKLLGDSNEPNRAAAAGILAALVKLAGTAQLGQVLDSLDEHKKKRVMDAVATTTVQAARDQPSAISQAPPQQRQQSTTNSQQQRKAPAGSGNVDAVSAPTSGKAAVTAGRRIITGKPGQKTNGSATGPGRPPAMPAPASPVSRISRVNTRLQPPRKPTSQSLLSPNQGASGDVSMGLTSPTPRNEPTSGRPSLSSTPKIVKRSLATTEFTPARGSDAFRRRIHSPGRPGAVNASLDHRMKDETRSEDDESLDADGVALDVNAIARLSAELELERKLRLEAEKRLAVVQVEKEREIRRLQEERAMLELRLRTQQQEFEMWAQQSDRWWSQSSSDVGHRLSGLSLEASSDPPSRPDSAQNSHAPTVPSQQPQHQSHPPQRSIPRVVPLARPQPSQNSARDQSPTRQRQHQSGSDSWENAVNMTQSLRARVEQLKAARAQQRQT